MISYLPTTLYDVYITSLDHTNEDLSIGNDRHSRWWHPRTVGEARPETRGVSAGRSFPTTRILTKKSRDVRVQAAGIDRYFWMSLVFVCFFNELDWL